MNINRILKNNVSILVGQTNTGKTMLLVNLALEYLKAAYPGTVYTYGLKPEVTRQLDVTPFSSVMEMETLHDGIILVDEVGRIFDLDNRTLKRKIEETLRQVTHNNNRIVLSGLPTDFKKFLASKATCYLWKSLTIDDLINRSMVQRRLKEYTGDGKGSYVLDLPINQVLIYEPSEDQQYYIDDVKYYRRFDTKRKNIDLLEKK